MLTGGYADNDDRALSGRAILRVHNSSESSPAVAGRHVCLCNFFTDVASICSQQKHPPAERMS